VATADKEGIIGTVLLGRWSVIRERVHGFVFERSVAGIKRTKHFGTKVSVWFGNMRGRREYCCLLHCIVKFEILLELLVPLNYFFKIR